MKISATQIKIKRIKVSELKTELAKSKDFFWASNFAY